MSQPKGKEHGRFLARRFLEQPGLGAALQQIIDRAEAEGERLGYGQGRLAEEARMRALQLFEHTVGVPPGTVRTRHDYRWAAAFVRQAGRKDDADLLAEFGDVVDNDCEFGYGWEHPFDGDVEPYHRRWAARHRAWAEAPAIPPPPVSVRPLAPPRPGIDGTACTLAALDGLPGGTRPAVIIHDGAGRAEAVAFPGTRDASTWLAARTSAAGPLPTTADGPPCRPAWEEEVLARLLADPADPVLRALVGDGTWTCHLRAEIFLATAPYRDGHKSPAQVRDSLAHQMLRAPGWALEQIGWPGAGRAMAYLDRLLATPVTAPQAHAAARALAPVPGPAPLSTQAPPAPRRIPAPARAGLRPALPPRPVAPQVTGTPQPAR